VVAPWAVAKTRGQQPHPEERLVLLDSAPRLSPPEQKPAQEVGTPIPEGGPTLSGKEGTIVGSLALPASPLVPAA